MRRIAVLDAPSNLGLRPPTETSVPGCAKAPGALRDHGLLRRLGARDAGCLTPPRYDPGDWRPGDGVCHAASIAAYSRALADRIGAIIDAGEFPVVLGGDCSIVLGSALAMHRLGEAVGGRIGLVFVDGHSDFRHPGNASYVGAAAGEDLALVTGRGQADLAAIEGRRPYFRDIDVVVMGIRGHDEYRLDLQAAGIVTRPVPTLRAEGAARSAQWARDQLVDCAGYWVHVDVDVLDPAVMPAVDAPEPGGIAFPELELLLAGLVDTPHCLGVEITVFDPDYDSDGSYAEEITGALVAGLAPVRAPDAPAAADRARAGREQAALDRDGGPEVDDRPSQLRPAAGPAVAAPPVVPVVATPPMVPVVATPPVVPVVATPPALDTPPLVATPPVVPVAAAPPLVAARAVDPGDRFDAFEEDEPVGDAPDVGYVEDDEPVGDAPDVGYVEDDEPVGDAPDVGYVEDDEPAGDAPDVGYPAAEAPDPVAPDHSVQAEHHDAPGRDGTSRDDAPDEQRWGAERPLGAAPLLDSEPLPATMPGLLRPRGVDAFTLPVQRPAFDIGPGEPADRT